MELFARFWLGALVVFQLALFGSCVLGSRTQRERGRSAASKFWSDGGWVMLSMTLKFIGYSFPKVERHVPWLWIPPLILALLGWALRGATWIVKWRKRTRPAQTAYTRSLRTTMASRERTPRR